MERMPMPMIHIELIEGRTDEQLAAFVAELTDAACRHLRCSREGVIVSIRDLPLSRYATGGVLWKDCPRPKEP
jgi:4-oxalocrotonate tautomerase